jgi:hypothetical protein
MAILYTSVPFSQSGLTYGGGQSSGLKLANVLKPNGDYGEMNIIKKFNWTYSPKTDAVLKEVPYIKLKEFYLLESYWNQLFKAYGKNTTSSTDIGQALLNPLTLNANTDLLYQGLYDHTNPSGFTYTFPFFSDEYLKTTNSWVSKPMFEELVQLQKTFTGFGAAGIGGIIGGLIGAIPFIGSGGGVNAVMGAKVGKAIAERTFMLDKAIEGASMGLTSPISMGMTDPAIDKPHLWSTTLPRSFNIVFPLFNTLTQPKSKDWQRAITQNWEFCHLLCYQNLYNKRNLFTGIPPVFYEIDVPGIHYSKAGYVSDLQIFNVGNIRKMTLPLDTGDADVNIPDAYLVNLVITDFFIPSKNFLSSICNKNKGSLTQSEFEWDLVNDAESVIERDPLTGLPADAFQDGVGGGGIK